MKICVVLPEKLSSPLVQALSLFITGLFFLYTYIVFLFLLLLFSFNLSAGKKGYQAYQRMDQLDTEMQDEAYQNQETEITIL